MSSLLRALYNNYLLGFVNISCYQTWLRFARPSPSIFYDSIIRATRWLAPQKTVQEFREVVKIGPDSCVSCQRKRTKNVFRITHWERVKANIIIKLFWLRTFAKVPKRIPVGAHTNWQREEGNRKRFFNVSIIFDFHSLLSPFSCQFACFVFFCERAI